MVYYRERIEIYIREEMYKAESGEVLYMEVPLSFPCEVLKSTDFLKSTCDNTHGVFATQGSSTKPQCPYVLLEPHHINMINYPRG